MQLFKSDLFQLVATGFAVGSMATVLFSGPDMWAALLPDVIAAVL